MEKTFGDLVREKRRSMGLNIIDAAKRCNVSSRGYCNIELNHADPKLSSLLAIAAMLQIDLGELNFLKAAMTQDEN